MLWIGLDMAMHGSYGVGYCDMYLQHCIVVPDQIGQTPAYRYRWVVWPSVASMNLQFYSDGVSVDLEFVCA